jgi:N-acetylmuramoyl-L-alanine amidase
MTLDMGLRVRDALRANTNHNIRVYMTRTADVNVRGSARPNVAQAVGADVFLSIHFNANGPTTRGTETYVRATANGNVNHDEDVALAQRIQNAVFGAIPRSRDRGVRDDTASQHPTGLAVLSDRSLGNIAAFHPIRACLVEIEFITNADVDALFNTAADRDDNRRRVAEAIAGAIVDDLLNQP